MIIEALVPDPRRPGSTRVIVDGRPAWTVPADVVAALGLAPARPLFRAPLTAALIDFRNIYVPTSDGQRFLISLPDMGAERERITMLANWATGVRRDTVGRTAASRLARLLP